MQSHSRLTALLLTRRGIVILLIGIALLTVLGLTLASTRKPDIDRLPTESSEADYSSQANIHEGLELLRALDGGERYNALSKDLHVFAKKTIKSYENENKIVGFMLTSKIIKQENKLSFEGEYGSSSDTIKVTAILLANNRLETSLTNVKRDINIDAELPSNSPTNKFIATLPIDGQKYQITYLESQNLIFINVFERNPNLSNEAYERVKKAIGDSFKDESVSISYPAPEPSEFGESPESGNYNPQTGEIIEGS